MEEAILEIIKKHISINYVDDWCHEEYHSKPVIVGYEPSAQEITSMVKEFIEWVGAMEYYFDHGNNAWITETEPYIKWVKPDELFQYWNDNVKNK